MLARANALVNDDTITQDNPLGAIDYFHLDFGSHDCVLANGAWSESYFEDGNRAVFHNAADYYQRFPDYVPQRQATCLPIVTADHESLPGLRASLAPVGAPGLPTGDTEPYLLANGRAIALVPAGANTWQADLPADLRYLRLCTRNYRPSDVSDCPDQRMLGMAVRFLTIGATLIDLATLDGGWHEQEQDGEQPWRWTNGYAVIPTAGINGGLVRLTLHGSYPPAPVVKDVAAPTGRGTNGVVLRVVA